MSLAIETRPHANVTPRSNRLPGLRSVSLWLLGVLAVLHAGPAFAADELDEAATDLARQIAAGPPVAHRFMKENLNRATHADLSTCLHHEADRMVRGAKTEDYLEAVAAFSEKRKPVFQGR